MRKFFFFLFFSVSSALAQEDIALKNILKDMQNLSEENLTYQPGPNRIDAREVRFKEASLAYLYLKALQEQYETAGVQTPGHIEKRREALLNNRAHHIFDDLNPEPFSSEVNYITHFWVLPDPMAPAKIKLLKLKKYEEIEAYKREYLRALTQGENPQEMAGKILETLRSFPGNSDDARLAYLKAKFLESPDDKEIQNLESELKYQAGLIQRKLQTELKSADWAMHFFQRLAFDFQAKFDQDYVVWTKLAPFRAKSNYSPIRHFPEDSHHFWKKKFEGDVSLQFYITETSLFMQDVLEQQIPWNIITAWKALKARPGNFVKSREEGLKFSFRYLLFFRNQNKENLSQKSLARVDQLIEKLSQEGEEVTGDQLTFRLREVRRPKRQIPFFVQGKPSFRLPDGRTLKRESVVGVFDSSNSERAIEAVAGNYGSLNASFLDDYKNSRLIIHSTRPNFTVAQNYHIEKVISREEGLTGLSIPFLTPYLPPQYASHANLIRLRNFDGKVRISSITFKASNAAVKYFYNNYQKMTNTSALTHTPFGARIRQMEREIKIWEHQIILLSTRSYLTQEEKRQKIQEYQRTIQEITKHYLKR